MSIDLDALSYVKSENGLRKKEKMCKIRRIVVHEMNKSVSSGIFKENGCIDCEVVKKIMICLEELVLKKYGINKFELLIQICSELFGTLSNQEIENLKKQVEYNIDNSLIKKIPSYRWFGFKLIKLLKKRLLE